MSQELQVDSIVKVVGEGHIHSGKQGQIVGFDEKDEETPVRVWFGRECDHLNDLLVRDRVYSQKKYVTEPPPPEDQENCTRVWNYSPNQLEAVPEWDIETLAKRHFPRMYNCWSPMKHPFVPGGKDCDVRGCDRMVTRRILCNIWGAVFQADVCEECAPEFHLQKMDGFPWKERPPTKITD